MKYQQGKSNSIFSDRYMSYIILSVRLVKTKSSFERKLCFKLPSYNISFREVRAGTKTEPTELSCLQTYCLLFILNHYTTKDHVPMGGNVHSGLDHYFSINFPQTGLQVTKWWHFLNWGSFSQISLACVQLMK